MKMCMCVCLGGGDSSHITPSSLEKSSMWQLHNHNMDLNAQNPSRNFSIKLHLVMSAKPDFPDAHNFYA